MQINGGNTKRFKQTSRRFYTQQRKPRNYSIENSRNGEYDSIHLSPHRKNTLQQFQQQLKNMKFTGNARLLKSKRNIPQKKYEKMQIDRQAMELSSIKQNLNIIKQRIQNKKQDYINSAIQSFLHKSRQNSIVLPTIQPQYNPYLFHPPPPPPVYYPLRHPPKKKYYESSQQSEQQRRNYKKNKRKNFPKKKFNQLDKLRYNKLLKKVFRAVTYIFYLKKLTKLIINKRKIIFNKFWPDNLLKATNGMRKWFSLSCKSFFDQMIRKSQTQLQIDGNENEKQLNYKRKIFKQLTKIFIQCLQKLVQNKNFEQIAQIMHIFCKHGAYIDNGVLTPQQIDTVCISEVYGYLRMDTYLQKSQIINFLFLKILLYNMLLQPWKYNSQLFNINQNQQGYQNFYTYSSIFYQIMLQLQEKLLETSSNSDKNISIGNWNQLKNKFKIKCSPSLCHLDTNYEKDQFISGLLSEKVVETIFKSQLWSQQLMRLENIIDQMHHKMRKIHARFINQVYDYKNIQRFNKKNQSISLFK